MDCKDIELEGTKAQLRVLEQRSRPTSGKSPDIIPTSDTSSDHLLLSRTEITTASMKAMSPLPLNLQLDHSSSTESAHDQAEANNVNSKKGEQARRKPSKIPLVKNYAAPKPPCNGGVVGNGGGKHVTNAPGARSRSGESPGRPHSAQSWRNNKSEGNSLNNKSRDNSLHKSRNGSLVNAKDSLTVKTNNSPKLRESPSNSFGSGRNTLRKTPSIRRTSSIRDSPEAKVRSKFWNWLRILDNGPT